LGTRAVSEPVVPGVPAVEGTPLDWPGVGAGAGPVPLGIRFCVVPVPGVPAFEGMVVDCPGVGAGAGPVPLGDAVPPGAALPVEPAAPDDAPPVLPPPLDPPVWANVRAVLAVRNATVNNVTLVCLGCIAPSCDRRPSMRVQRLSRRLGSAVEPVAASYVAAATILIHERAFAMGLFTKDIQTMDDLFLHGLKDIYYAENQIVKSLPKLIEKATNRDLSKGLRDHLEETKTQIGRLDQVFKKLGKPSEGVKCPGIDGLIEEADELASEVADKEVLDAAIVSAAQGVEHYEICRYGTLIAWADSLGHDDVVRFLTTNLNEEKAADKRLSSIALRKGVNRKAAS
jgi:ferritin-like metal-binding protein YciE